MLEHIVEAGGNHATDGGNPSRFRGGAIPREDIGATPDEILRHRLAHGAETDEADGPVSPARIALKRSRCHSFPTS
jgi:hypothetical protein